MNQGIKTITHTVPKYGTVQFNADHAAALTQDQFLAEHADKYPDLPEQDRKAVLTSIYRRVIKEAKDDSSRSTSAGTELQPPAGSNTDRS